MSGHQTIFEQLMNFFTSYCVIFCYKKMKYDVIKVITETC